MADAADDEQMHDATDVPWDASNDPWNVGDGIPDFDALFGRARARTGTQPAAATPTGANNPWQQWTPQHTGSQPSGVPTSWDAVSGGGSNYPVFTDGQHVWEKKEEADRAPEWDGNDPLNNLEVYINSLKFLADIHGKQERSSRKVGVR